MYLSKSLSVLTYANGFTLWHYVGSDPISKINESGYFNDAAHLVRRGDMILVTILNDNPKDAAKVAWLGIASNVDGVIKTVQGNI